LESDILEDQELDGIQLIFPVLCERYILTRVVFVYDLTTSVQSSPFVTQELDILFVVSQQLKLYLSKELSLKKTSFNKRSVRRGLR
jgi:hypothetical protein